MGRVVGIGVVGMGWMGEAHSRAYRLVGDRFAEREISARLVACADVDPARAAAAQARYGFERSTTDWRDIVDDPAVEAISITAPNDAHLEIIRAALGRGKHVNCEKPVGRTPEETLVAAELARAAGRITFVGYNYRWAPVVQHAANLIAGGALGQLTHYRGRFPVAPTTTPPRPVLPAVTSRTRTTWAPWSGSAAAPGAPSKPAG